MFRQRTRVLGAVAEIGMGLLMGRAAPRPCFAGADPVRGYLFAKPLVREEIEDLLRDGARLVPAGSELDPSRVS